MARAPGTQAGHVGVPESFIALTHKQPDFTGLLARRFGGQAIRLGLSASY